MNEFISVKGIILPNKPLTNIQIIDTVNKLKIRHFRGVFCRNELPHKVNVKECGIINLDDSWGEGTHWCCWFKRVGFKCYFDSFGLQPPNEIVQYLKTRILYSTDGIQPDGTAICGHLCLYVLNRLSHDEDMKLIINTLY
jgi:hypothetical protein